jgi:putative DNA primase/helicase
MALGPIRGGAARLASAGETLALAEGIETALSVQQATGIPTWAALGTANLLRVELPAIVREIIICADADSAGEKAAQEAARRFLRDGRRVRIALPASANDFNDVLTGLSS